MKRLVILGVLAASGCMLSSYRQRSVGYSLAQLARARDEIAAAAGATVEAAEEVASAAEEERAPDLARPLGEVASALEGAHAACDEAGKTLAIVQEDLGCSPEPPPADAASAASFRQQYRSASRLWKMALSWARTQLPGLSRLPGGGSPSPGGRIGK